MSSTKVPVEDTAGHTPLASRLKHPLSGLREKIKLDHPKLYDLKVELIQKKHQLGKFGNLINPNHRHDEEHERQTDEKRQRIGESHRFQSYAPERSGHEVKWYVDGRDYCWAVSVALERAQDTIYIADWWLSPELFLRRPPYYHQEWRLDQILKRRAEAGVRIFVIVYKEIEQAITCNSNHTKQALRALCPEGSPGYGNINVMRHPDHNFLENAGDMTFYWAHHEKFLVIDYHLAFVGGIDLCFGRWDTRQHPMADVHPAGVTNEIWPGQDWNNNRIMDFQHVEDWKSNALSKADYGRMPWHDVAMGLIGPCVYDIAEHFVLRWNFIKRDKYKRDSRFPWLTMEGREGLDEDLIGVQRPKHPVGEYVRHPLTPLGQLHPGPEGTVHAQVIRSSCDWSSGILPDHSIQNAYVQIISSAQHYVYIENQFFITATGENQSPINNMVGKAIVDACVRAGREGRKFRVIVLIPAIPGFAGDLRDDAAAGTRAIMDYQYKSIYRGEHSIYQQVAAQGVEPKNHLFFFNLRSFDRLNKTSAVKKQEEISGVEYQDVQRAHAQEMMGDGLQIHPESHRHHLRRDHNGDEEREHIAEQRRRFEAKHDQARPDESVKTADSIASCALLGESKVSDEPWEGDPETERENFVQEELYVHAKVLIVDDRIVICGSANINDRSQLGIHDSELAVVLEDSRVLPSTMDGQSFQAGYHAATLRRQLWREHMGLLPAQSLDASNDPNAQPPGDCPNDVSEGREFEMVADPLSDEVWAEWTQRADKNTEVFRRLFHTDPDDNVRTFEQYDRFLPKTSTRQGHLFDAFMPVDEIRALFDQIRGHLVWMPLDFLKDVEMAEKGLQVNSWTESVYT